MLLTRGFYQRDAVTIARDLLGQQLVRVIEGQRVAGRIVEVEAYLGLEDKAAHTYAGRCTPRNRSMWGEAGHAYVYLIYGIHHCLNVVASGPGDPVAVLVRALEPTEGLDAMRMRRTVVRKETDLCSGPAKLCQALGIDRTLDGADLTAGPLCIEQTREQPRPAERILVRPRIGIGYAGEWTEKPLRFYLEESRHVTRR